MKENNTIDIQSLVTPEVAGIIWISKKTLEEKPEHFDIMDYFLDGIITKQISANNDNREKSLFISKNFNKTFFVAHLLIDSAAFEKNIKNTLETIEPMCTDRRNVLLIEPASSNLIKNIKKFKPKFTLLRI